MVVDYVMLCYLSQAKSQGGASLSIHVTTDRIRIISISAHDTYRRKNSASMYSLIDNNVMFVGRSGLRFFLRDRDATP